MSKYALRFQSLLYRLNMAEKTDHEGLVGINRCS